VGKHVALFFKVKSKIYKVREAANYFTYKRKMPHRKPRSKSLPEI
jgi:hypothetical protein